MNLFTRGRALLFLIALDFFMAGAAFKVDWHDFFEVPWYLIPFTPICPLYPLLLAINYVIFKTRGAFNRPLLHFTAIGIVSYGIMAYIFYPGYLFIKGFAWYELGNMVWVTLYASQIFLIWPHLKKISAWWYLLFAGYFFTKDFLDRFSVTFSYMRYGEFTDAQANVFFVAIVLLHALSLAFLMAKNYTNCQR